MVQLLIELALVATIISLPWADIYNYLTDL